MTDTQKGKGTVVAVLGDPGTNVQYGDFCDLMNGPVLSLKGPLIFVEKEKCKSLAHRYASEHCYKIDKIPEESQDDHLLAYMKNAITSRKVRKGVVILLSKNGVYDQAVKRLGVLALHAGLRIVPLDVS